MRFRMLDIGVLFATQYVMALKYILWVPYHDLSIFMAHVILRGAKSGHSPNTFTHMSFNLRDLV